jgi:hypothetical protein
MLNVAIENFHYASGCVGGDEGSDFTTNKCMENFRVVSQKEAEDVMNDFHKEHCRLSALKAHKFYICLISLPPRSREHEMYIVIWVFGL